VLLAALRAPASFNFQPYTFVEIRDPQNCAELADIAQHQGLDT
jgi:nitroreductase